jgi:hypothetical protein
MPSPKKARPSIDQAGARFAHSPIFLTLPYLRRRIDPRPPGRPACALARKSRSTLVTSSAALAEPRSRRHQLRGALPPLVHVPSHLIIGELARLYASARLFVNFFQPSFKLLEKRRDGALVRKRYDTPATPCQRLLADARTPQEVRTKLETLQKQLDPVRTGHRLSPVGLLRRRRRPQSRAAEIVGLVKLVQSSLQVLKLINNFFTIPARSWPGRLSRRREGENAEDVSAHKPGAGWSVREFERDTSSAN